MKRMLTAVAAAALAVPAVVVGAATPALASNEVMVKVDPLDWTWSGDVVLYDQKCTNYEDFEGSLVCTDYGPGKELDRSPFTVQPGQGPQTVYSMDWTQSDEMFIMLENGTLTGDGVTQVPDVKGAQIVDPAFGKMFLRWEKTELKDVPVELSFIKGETVRNNLNFLFYEMKFFPKYDAPSLQNLREAGKDVRGDDDWNCTITGTPDRDFIIGTEGDDIICAFGGDDVIYSLGGNDLILAGAGNDRVFGGAGGDRILGGAGNDKLHGNDGGDQISGGKGRDRLYGTEGVDWLNGGKGKDRVKWSPAL